jgi:oxygen-independent coproporphyrinogen-3 oxidase
LANSDSGISLYVHVPFCADKCLYCDFYSVPCHTVSRELQTRVVQETIRQAKAFLDALPTGAPIPTIFMGGGTPSSLPRELLAELLQPFRFPSCTEWTIEANPESLDESFLDICHSVGATRISVGVQSLRDEQLRLLKRPATRTDTLRALELMARKWRGDLSVDYIAGIPMQTPRQVREDIAVLRDFGPSHFSLYQLTCEPDTELAAMVEQGRIELNPPDRDEELWFAGKEALQDAGYEHYEISNFCLPGKECLHNLRYWRMEPYLGVGPGAVSTLPARPFGSVLQERDRSVFQDLVLRLSNPRDIQAFIEDANGQWGMTEEVVEPADFLLENLMMGLRLARGISLAVFEKRFGRSFDAVFPGLWSTWVARGFAEPQQSSLRLSAGGRLVLDALLGEIVERLTTPAVAGLAICWP